MPKIKCPNCNTLAIVAQDDVEQDDGILCQGCGRPFLYGFKEKPRRLAPPDSDDDSPRNRKVPQKHTRQDHANQPKQRSWRFWLITIGVLPPVVFIGILAVFWVPGFVGDLMQDAARARAQREGQARKAEMEAQAKEKLAQARVFVDNGEPAAITVLLDDKVVLEVPPNSAKDFRCRPGEHVIMVKTPQGVISYGTKNLQAVGEAPPLTYLLNPGSKARQGSCVMKYNISGFRGFELVHSEDERILKLIEKIQLVEVKKWQELKADHVFEPAPSSVPLAARDSSATRLVVFRIEPADYAALKDAGSRQRFTNEERARLQEIVSKLLKSNQQ